MTTTTTTTTRAAGLLWEDPPEVRARGGRYAAAAVALKERAGEWAVLKTYPRTQSKRAWGFASAVNGGKFRDLREGFEACARTVGDEVRVYVRASVAVSR